MGNIRHFKAFFPSATVLLSLQASLVPYVTSDGFVDGASSEEARAAFNTGVKTFLSVYPYDRHAVNVALRDPEDGGDGSIKAARASLGHFGLGTAARKVIDFLC